MSAGEEYLNAIHAELERGRRQWRRGDKLLEAFGYTRRRQTAIDLINGLLKSKGMSTDPRLTTSMPLDRGITFYLKGTRRRQAAEPVAEAKPNVPVEEIELASGRQDGSTETVTIPQEPPVADPRTGAERSLIVGILACAERIPEQINPSATLERALTKMAVHDYSQLVVTTGPRDIKGIISYKSVAQAYLHGQPKKVSDCLDASVPIVDVNEPLLRVVELFNEHSAVLVMGQDRALSGIVTPADIAVEFRAMAAPFLLIGQIEEQLRWLVQKNLPDLGAALNVVSRTADLATESTVSDLTMGELHRVLDHDDNWGRVGIRFDRREFCQELNAVREVRNTVMHFRDPPEGGLDRLNRFANVVRTAYLASAT